MFLAFPPVPVLGQQYGPCCLSPVLSGAPPAEVAPRFSGWRKRSVSVAAVRPFWAVLSPPVSSGVRSFSYALHVLEPLDLRESCFVLRLLVDRARIFGSNTPLGHSTATTRFCREHSVLEGQRCLCAAGLPLSRLRTRRVPRGEVRVALCRGWRGSK